MEGERESEGARERGSEGAREEREKGGMEEEGTEEGGRRKEGGGRENARACAADRVVIHEIAAEAAGRRRDAALGVGEEGVAGVRAVGVERGGAGEEVGGEPDVVLHDGDESALGEQQPCSRAVAARAGFAPAEFDAEGGPLAAAVGVEKHAGMVRILALAGRGGDWGDGAGLVWSICWPFVCWI